VRITVLLATVLLFTAIGQAFRGHQRPDRAINAFAAPMHSDVDLFTLWRTQ